MLDISVLIVNYNTADLVKLCIESVLRQRDANYEIIVMDNASVDESVAVLRAFGDQITLIANQDNLGFGKSNNQGFHISQGRYLFLLNPDAECLTEYDLCNAVKYMDEHPQYGLVGTRIVDSIGQVDETAWDHYPRQKQASIDFSTLPGKWATVLGASMVVRRDVYEKIGGFDEDYFLYAEETDLCLRIRQQNYQIGYYTGVTVRHIGGASASKNPAELTIRRKKQAKFLFYSKHYPLADVVRMAKKDLSQARWHRLRLWLKKKILGLSAADEYRYVKYKITTEVASRYCGYSVTTQ